MSATITAEEHAAISRAITAIIPAACEAGAIEGAAIVAAALWKLACWQIASLGPDLLAAVCRDALSRGAEIRAEIAAGYPTAHMPAAGSA